MYFQLFYVFLNCFCVSFRAQHSIARYSGHRNPLSVFFEVAAELLPLALAAMRPRRRACRSRSSCRSCEGSWHVFFAAGDRACEKVSQKQGPLRVSRRRARHICVFPGGGGRRADVGSGLREGDSLRVAKRGVVNSRPLPLGAP